MTSENVTEAESVEAVELQSARAVDHQLIDELVGRTQAQGLQLTGEGGLLQQLTKRLLESALEGEITDHLGYDKHDPAGKPAATAATGPGPRPCSRTSARWRWPCPATVKARSSRRSSRSGRSVCPASTNDRMAEPADRRHVWRGGRCRCGLDLFLEIGEAEAVT